MGVKFGVYYFGVFDWYVSDFLFIEFDMDFFWYCCNDEYFVCYLVV